MCELSHRIREQPNWWEKMEDKAIIERWGEEALQQQEDDGTPSRMLTPAMVKVLLSLNHSLRPHFNI